MRPRGRCERDHPEIGAQRTQVAAALKLDLAPVPVLLARLREAVASTEPDHVLSDNTGEFGSLFGTLLPSRNPGWR